VKATGITPTLPEPVLARQRFLGSALVKGQAPGITLSAAIVELPFLSANVAIWQAFGPDLRRRLAEFDDAATSGDWVRALLLGSARRARS